MVAKNGATVNNRTPARESVLTFSRLADDRQIIRADDKEGHDAGLDDE